MTRLERVAHAPYAVLYALLVARMYDRALARCLPYEVRV